MVHPRTSALLPVWMAIIAVSMCGLNACSGISRSGAPTAAAVSSTTNPQPPPLYLCRPPNMPPVSLRSRPGYTQFEVSVTGADGVPVGGLTRSDFAARCGGRPCPIAYFHEEANSATPVSIAVVEDASSSMYAKLVVRRGDIKKAYAEFDDAVEKFNQCDEAALVMVGGEYRGALASRWPPLGKVTLAQPFTTDSYRLLLRNKRAPPR